MVTDEVVIVVVVVVVVLLLFIHRLELVFSVCLMLLDDKGVNIVLSCP